MFFIIGLIIKRQRVPPPLHCPGPVSWFGDLLLVTTQGVLVYFGVLFYREDING